MKFSVKCVLFDLDGTLVDTAPDLGYAANCVRAEQGLPPLPVIDYRPAASAGARGLLKIALDLAPEHAEYPKARDNFLDYYRHHLSRDSRLFGGMDEFLRSLEQRGIAWGVVTNKPAWLTNPLMQELQLSARAACCVSGDEVVKAKPAPDSLLKACALLRLTANDCVYVGDDKRDIDAGRAAGMPTIAAAWGYLGGNGPIESWNADCVVQTPSQLADLL